MTKKKMQETLTDEYIKAMDMWYFFYHTMVEATKNDDEILAHRRSANRYHIEAETIERMYKKLFGNDVNLYYKYLETI